MSVVIQGKILADNIKGFNIVTYYNVTRVTVKDGDTEITFEVTTEMATDMSNAILRSIELPSVYVTGKEMRELRAKE